MDAGRLEVVAVDSGVFDHVVQPRRAVFERTLDRIEVRRDPGRVGEIGRARFVDLALVRDRRDAPRERDLDAGIPPRGQVTHRDVGEQSFGVGIGRSTASSAAG